MAQDNIKLNVVVQSLSSVWIFASPWTSALQPSLSFPSSTAYWNSCPSSQWCHPTILSSVVSFSFCLQSFPASVFSKLNKIKKLNYGKTNELGLGVKEEIKQFSGVVIYFTCKNRNISVTAIWDGMIITKGMEKPSTNSN